MGPRPAWVLSGSGAGAAAAPAGGDGLDAKAIEQRGLQSSGGGVLHASSPWFAAYVVLLPPLLARPRSQSMRTPIASWRRQLGVKLHPLGEQLPLLDTATGLPVPAELDQSVEK